MQSGTENSDNTKLSHSQLTPVVDCATGPVRGLIDTQTGATATSVSPTRSRQSVITHADETWIQHRFPPYGKIYPTT